MHNNRGRKHKILLHTWQLLICLLAFFMLVSLLPTALSLEMPSRLIGSAGTITYPPSPPPPPPYNDTMPSDFMAYTGWEPPTTIWNMWESNPARVTAYWVHEGSAGEEITTSRYKSGTRSARMWSYYRNAFALYNWGGTQVYISVWIYIPIGFSLQTSRAQGSAQFFEFRESDQWTVNIDLYQSSPYGADDLYWRFCHVHVGPWYSDWLYTVYKTRYVANDPVTPTPIVNPFEVPVGRWFRLELYLVRSTSNGVFQVWITDPENPNPAKRSCTTLFSAVGVPTSKGASPEYVTIPKLYCGATYYQPPSLYFDELYIYGYNAH